MNHPSNNSLVQKVCNSIFIWPQQIAHNFVDTYWTEHLAGKGIFADVSVITPAVVYEKIDKLLRQVICNNIWELASMKTDGIDTCHTIQAQDIDNSSPNTFFIGFHGSIDVGKDCAANYLLNKYFNVQRCSFAGSLKDAVAILFGMDRWKLEGTTKENKEWREQPDEFWTRRVAQTGVFANDAHITPRRILQLMGTEIGRQNIHKDIWALSVQKQLSQTLEFKTSSIVITDVRFDNEAEWIRKSGGVVVKIVRCPKYSDANVAKHQSESGIREDLINFVVDNNSTLEMLYQQLDSIVEQVQNK